MSIHPHSTYGLENHGIVHPDDIYWTLNTPLLYEQALLRHEGRLAHLGPLVVRTGQYTGRSPKDKFIVEDSDNAKNIAWGAVNQPMTRERYSVVRARLMAYLQGRDLFVQDCFVGANPTYRMPVRIITESAWASLFSRNMFIQATPEELAIHIPEFTVIQAPGFQAIPEVDGTRSEVFIVVDFVDRVVIIGGTQYAGEIKKSIFTVMNYLLPMRGVTPMHCSANYGADGEVAIFFGLSGTGKTTLSTDPLRTLIGDDEHAWCEDGIFNLEGGCYAKTIRLSRTAEPDIYEACRKFGTILENVGYDPTSGRIDLDDDILTENTRAAYPISHIPNATRRGVAGHPKHIVMLTADAFGVLPPIAQLSPQQAMYHFLSGYTAKVAGTERGLTEPQATFSACFGEPFMVWHPTVYAKLLAKQIQQHHARIWLVNTGWSGGPYGIGERIKIAYTRAMVHAILDGGLDEVEFCPDPIFNVNVPMACPNVPAQILNPRNTWKDQTAYDVQAGKLAAMFTANFLKYAEMMPSEVVASGPRQAAP